MTRPIIFLAIIAAIVTLITARVMQRRLSPERRLRGALAAGLTFPFLTAALAIAFFVLQPGHKAAWSDLALGAMLRFAFYAVPICFGTSLLVFYLPRRRT